MKATSRIVRALVAVATAVSVCGVCGCQDGQAEAAPVAEEASVAEEAAAETRSSAPSIAGLLGGKGSDKGTTSGPAYTQPAEVTLSPAEISSADATEWGTIDTSTANEGYVTVAVLSSERIKFQILCGEMSYNYDVPGDGTPVTCPLNMGNGYYTFRVMQNTSGNNYVELNADGAEVWMEDEFSPFLRPNVICNYNADSQCVRKAQELVSGSKNEGDALQAVCNYVIANVTYDNDKAAELANASGYVPAPDETFRTETGICFDFASLGAAMLRSQGIPTRVMTGYVSPEEVYHSWISVYIDGTWHNVQFTVDTNNWERVDLTFATGASAGLVGDGKEYTDRYMY